MSNFVESGNILFGAKLYQDAILEYTKALETTEDSVKIRAYGNRSQCWINVKDFQKGLQDAEQVLTLEPFQVKAILKKIKCLEELNRKNQCIEFILLKTSQVNDSVLEETKVLLFTRLGVLDLESLILEFAKLIRTRIGTSKQLKEIEDKGFHQTWHVIDYFDGNLDKKFQISCPMGKFAPHIQDPEQVLEIFSKFSLCMNQMKSSLNLAFIAALIDMKKPIIYKSQLVDKLGLNLCYPKCITCNWFDVPSGGKLVVDYDTHWIVCVETKTLQKFLDFHSAQYSYFTKWNEHFVEFFDGSNEEKRDLYRIKNEKISYPEYSIGKYAKEHKVDTNNILTMQGAFEKNIKEKLLKINKLNM